MDNKDGHIGICKTNMIAFGGVHQDTRLLMISDLTAMIILQMHINPLISLQHG